MVKSPKLIERYRELKRQTPEYVLLMQVGVFMQVMDDDARTLASVTGLKLQIAGDVDDPVVVGGFPQSGLDAYVGKLARAGHSVALAFQNATKERYLAEQIRVCCEPSAMRKKGSSLSFYQFDLPNKSASSCTGIAL